MATTPIVTRTPNVPRPALKYRKIICTTSNRDRLPGKRAGLIRSHTPDLHVDQLIDGGVGTALFDLLYKGGGDAMDPHTDKLLYRNVLVAQCLDLFDKGGAD